MNNHQKGLKTAEEKKRKKKELVNNKGRLCKTQRNVNKMKLDNSIIKNKMEKWTQS